MNADIAPCPGMCRWKLVHGDVFRPPMYLELLAALVGTGVQLALLVLSVILITIAGDSASIHPVPQLPPTHRAAHFIAQCAMRAQVLTQMHAIAVAGGQGLTSVALCRYTVHGAGDHRDSVHYLLCAHVLCSRLRQVCQLHVLPLCWPAVCLTARA